MLPLPLHSSPLCRHSLDFAHVAMVYGGHLTIVPCNRDRVPTYFGDTAAVIGIASPINAAALLETLERILCEIRRRTRVVGAQSCRTSSASGLGGNPVASSPR